MKARAALWLIFGAGIAVAALPSSLNAQVQVPPPAIVKTPAAKPPEALPPDLAFGRSIAFIRGHLLTGDELVKQRAWDAALPHVRFPLEEIYGVIREDLRGYKTPPFDGALKALARIVGAHNAKQYPKAREKVEAALAAADAELKTRQPNWARFELQVAIETLKAAPDEYQDAVARDRIVHPLGYQTARGFILQADRMIESVAGELEANNADALRDMREGFTQLRQAFASVTAPKQAVMDDASVLGIVSRIELAAGKLM